LPALLKVWIGISFSKFYKLRSTLYQVSGKLEEVGKWASCGKKREDLEGVKKETEGDGVGEQSQIREGLRRRAKSVIHFENHF
jgi:hypothetical protein